MRAIELESPGEGCGDRECEEGEIENSCHFGCALGNKNRCDTNDNEVIGPNQTEEIARWLPRRLSEVGIPTISSVNPETRADHVDQY